MTSSQFSFKKIGLRLARPDIIFWITPLLIILLIVGTIAQKELGIYAAQEKYFSSFFFLLGIIPFPGGLTLMAIFSVNLLAKFIFKSDWSWKKSGTIISHFGVLVLVIGGLLSFATSREGYLVVPQGETRSNIEDYHERQLVIREGDKIIIAIPHENLKNGLKFAPPQIPFTLTLDKFCFNCGVSKRDPKEAEGWTVPGQFMQLNVKASDPQDEKNMTGIEFSVSGTPDNQDGKYLTFDKFPKPPQIKTDKATYTVSIERATRPLPFSVTLNEFEQDFHPGTSMASAFKSKVTVTDGNTKWPALIEMNEPLRYRGYTLYQSSFDMSGEKPFTVLAVVENKGRIFPYIATIIITIGLMIHLVIRLREKKTSNANNN